MDMPAITEAFRARMGEDSGLNATLKFDCGDDGVVVPVELGRRREA